MIKLVAFDWNGTLLSDTAVSLKVDNLALKKLGVRKIITLGEFRKYFHVPISEYWHALGMEKKFYKSQMYKIENIFHDFYEPLADKCRTRAGTKLALKWLKQNDIQAIIYSNHIKPMIAKQLARLKIARYLTTILAREKRDASLVHSRGKGQKLYDFTKEKKIRPREVISVGDTDEEIEIGKHYGFYTVAITGGYNSASRLKKHRPDFLIHNMKDLIGIIKRLNK